MKKIDDLFFKANIFGRLGCIDFLIKKEFKKLEFCDLGNPNGACSVFELKSKPDVSVIVTTYNAEKTIESSLASLQEQTLANIEIIVVDDNSDDNTCSILEKIQKNDARIKIIRCKENRGTYWAKNLGIVSATSEYVALQDSDDFSKKNRLQRQLEYLKMNDAIFCYTNWIRTDRAGNRVLNRGVYERLGYPTLMFQKKAIEIIGFYDSTRIAADDEFHKRITKYFKKNKILHLQDLLYTAPLNEGSLTSKNPVYMELQNPNNSLSFLSESRQKYVKSYTEWHNIQRDEHIINYPRRVREFKVTSEISSSDLKSDTVITGSIVSIPSRVESLEATIASIINQVDLLRVHLNNYDCIPDFLLKSKISITRSQDTGDLRDNGKFINTKTLRRGYHLTFDDDIVYPDYYVNYLVLKSMQYADRAVVGVHGTIINANFERYHDKNSRTTFTYKHKNLSDKFVHVLGTGTICYNTKLLDFDLNHIDSKGMVDLYFAKYCYLNEIPLVCVSRGDVWLCDGQNLPNESLYKEALNDDSKHSEIISKMQMWKKIHKLS